MAKDALDFVNDMLDNEKSAVAKNVKKNKKQKKYVKHVPTRPVTDADLELSGWNLKFEKDNVKGDWKKGQLIELSQKQEEWAGLPRKSGTKVVGTPSRFQMASVFNPYFSIYGRGVYVEDAIKDLLVNIKNWKDNATEADMARVNKFWQNRLSKAKKTEDKDVAGLLSEAGL